MSKASSGWVAGEAVVEDGGVSVEYIVGNNPPCSDLDDEEFPGGEVAADLRRKRFEGVWCGFGLPGKDAGSGRAPGRAFGTVLFNVPCVDFVNVGVGDIVGDVGFEEGEEVCVEELGEPGAGYKK